MIPRGRANPWGRPGWSSSSWYDTASAVYDYTTGVSASGRADDKAPTQDKAGGDASKDEGKDEGKDEAPQGAQLPAIPRWRWPIVVTAGLVVLVGAVAFFTRRHRRIQL